MNISLIGMMGSGKTTIAKLLVNHLTNFIFVDTDSLIVEKEQMSINEIFATRGEDYFRQIEEKILSETLEGLNLIISTGGGIVKSPRNLSLLKEKSVVFYLKASSEELYNRVKNNKERPLLNDVDMKSKIDLLINERAFLYEQANYTIETDDKSLQDVVKEILEKLSLYAKN